MEALPKASISESAMATVQKRRAGLEALEDIMFGSVAGIVGKYIEYPFDTVKVRLQSQPDNQPLRYHGPLDCFRQSIKETGVRGLYRGITAPLAGAALENSSLFFFERIGRELAYRCGYSRDQPLPLPALYFSGAFSGVFTSFVLTPIELVKCKIQVPAANGTTIYLKPIPVIRDVYRHHGFMGFWHGQLGTLIREAGGGAAWFGAKETLTKIFYAQEAQRAGFDEIGREAILARPLPLWKQAVAGGFAGVAYNFLFFPADTIKSRMQTVPIGSSVKGQTFMSEGKLLWKQHGVKGFYRGCGITCFRAAPSSAFVFIIFDGLKKYLPLD